MSQYKIEAGTGQHIGDRQEQQDRAALFAAPRAPGYMLAVLADGMGGHSGGALAAEQVIHTAKEIFERFSPLTDDPESILHTIAREADTVIKLSAISTEKRPHSTIVLLMLTPEGKAFWGHAGDSRLYQFEGPNFIRRTEDHTYQAHLAAQNRAQPVQSQNPAVASLLTNFLGGKQQNVKLSVNSHNALQIGDAFLLCSDGLWQFFTEAELGAAIATHPPRQACEMLIKKARERAAGIKADNCTLAIVKLTKADVVPQDYKARAMRRAV